MRQPVQTGGWCEVHRQAKHARADSNRCQVDSLDVDLWPADGTEVQIVAEIVEVPIIGR
jgi:hypothetical protein